MAYCCKCGAQVEENAKFCAQCGAELPKSENANYGSQNYSYQQRTDYGSYNNNGEEMFHPEDVKRNKVMGVLSYFGILVLVPILAGDKNSEYIKFHANQGLVLFILSTIIEIVEKVCSFVQYDILGFYSFSLFSWLFSIIDFAMLILVILGIVAACKGQKNELAIIGQIKILK